MTTHDAAMCKCGTVWLTGYTTVFHAEGREHSRMWCQRLIDPPRPIEELVGVLGSDWTGGLGSVEFVRGNRRG